MKSEMNKNLQMAKRFLIDFGTILILCLVFELLKSIYSSGGDPTSWHSLFNVIWILGVWVALTCYPAFLIGVRVKKSPAWFLVLSWVTVVLFFCLSLYPSTNLSYKVGDTYVFEHGKITEFGVFYTLLTPRTFMALWASWLFGKNRSLRLKRTDIN